jgi:hypothetical protein
LEEEKDNAEDVETLSSQRRIGNGYRSASNRNLRERVEVEVLRASPVNGTGVRTPDLIGCPQNDNFLQFLARLEWE